jgi:hypothetical protein
MLGQAKPVAATSPRAETCHASRNWGYATVTYGVQMVHLALSQRRGPQEPYRVNGRGFL